MKFKYYLRGIGLGILFATLLMTAAIYFHKATLSDDEIIERAQALGMVMPSSQQTGEDAETTETTESTDTAESAEEGDWADDDWTNDWPEDWTNEE